MKDLGSLNYFLGLEVTTTETGLFLSQAQYASDILRKVGLEDCKPSSSPSSAKVPLDPTDPLFLDVQLFRSLVGSLQYLTLTRLDISFPVNVVCQHMHQPKMSHYGAVKRILRYIKGTITQGLHFTAGSVALTAFVDADWVGDPVDRRSTTGYAIFLGSNLVSWCAKKQHTVARSSTEAEYRAMAHTAADLVWIQQLLTELKVPISPPHVLWCDNRFAIALANNPVFHARTKHIELDYHFIREQVLAK
ncbi:uncharacterized mitochondrial protein AtMg00810-like [Rhododendron vialii]|uniref:uncharacterized mitochondrial protein AtMg00810-like n=1 Tax=Rhododendron vialii TaxID=182163 RepID=UPI00265FC065|nr:uncharacterized mitochondrial protein AtMg00810-like [Rhododendron vialii]